jgi:hypothetical protein
MELRQQDRPNGVEAVHLEAVDIAIAVQPPVLHEALEPGVALLFAGTHKLAEDFALAARELAVDEQLAAPGVGDGGEEVLFRGWRLRGWGRGDS